MRITHVFCRRYRGVILGLLAAALVRDFLAGAQTSVKFTPNWKFEPPAAPFLVAVDRGYFTAEKLEVTIEPGSLLEPINRVASGVYDIGFGDINTCSKKKKSGIYGLQQAPRRDRRAQEPRHNDAERPGRKKARRAGQGCCFCTMAYLRSDHRDRRQKSDVPRRRIRGARADTRRRSSRCHHRIFVLLILYT